MAQRIYFGKLKLIRNVEARLPDTEYHEFIKNKGEKRISVYLRELIIDHNKKQRFIRENLEASQTMANYHPETNGPRVISIKKNIEEKENQLKNE